MSKFVLYRFLTVMGFLAFYNICANDPVFSRKPFNYKAYEARSRGYPVVIYRPAESVVSLESLKINPTWPGYLRFPNTGDSGVIHMEAGCDWANWAFNSRSELADPSKLVMGDAPVTVADASIIAKLHGDSLRDYLKLDSTVKSSVDDVSKPDNVSWLSSTIDRTTAADSEVVAAKAELAAQLVASSYNSTTAQAALDNLNKLTGLTNALTFRAYKRFLAFLANKEFEFKSKMRQPVFIFNYQAALFDNQVSVGIEVPIMVRMHEICMVSDLSIVDKQVLATDIDSLAIKGKLQDHMFAEYPGGFLDFYNHMLMEKEMITDPKNVRFGIGDVTFIMNRRMESPYWNQGLIGMGLTLPTATPPDRRHVWPAELGNGGFWEARLHSALYWQYSRILNLHALGCFRFRFSNSVDRRVARFISFDSKTGIASKQAKTLPLGGLLIFQNNSFVDIPESNVAALASGPLQFVEYRKGFEISTRVGNIFDQVVFNCAYLDLFYDFSFKFADALAYRYNDGQYDVDKVIDNSESWRHMLGLTYVYRWNDKTNLEARANYVFAGKKVLRECHLSLGLQIRF